jgi:hypothetical protein
MSDPNPLDVTRRCQNCGGTRKEHRVRKPYRCPTRLAETYWTPWTVEEYEAAEAASAARAQAEAARAQAAADAAKRARECPFCRLEHTAPVPTVHLNGTSAKELLGQFQATLDALHEAQRLMCAGAPNGRDYYPQPGNAMDAAMSAHERRWTELNRMMRELEEARDHVQAVMDFEAERRAR